MYASKLIGWAVQIYRGVYNVHRQENWRSFVAAYPLTRLEQRSERWSVLAQVVQELADIRIGFREHGEAIARADLCQDEQPAFVLQDCRSKGAAAGAQAETGGILRERGGERGKRFGLERLMRRMLDRESIGAEHQNRLHALSLNEMAHHLSKTGHPVALRGGEIHAQRMNRPG